MFYCKYMFIILFLLTRTQKQISQAAELQAIEQTGAVTEIIPPVTVSALADFESNGETTTEVAVLKQEEASEGTSAVGTTEVAEMVDSEPVSEVICAVCNCSDSVVDCSGKEIRTSFEMTDWEGLQEFKPVNVDLSNNHIGTLTRISKLDTLKYLNVSNCELLGIEHATFSYLQDLVSLDLSRNQLLSSSINKRVFVGIIDPILGLLPFSKLRYLSLANNEIHSLPQDVFLFMNELTTLDLSDNPMAYIDQVTMGAITDLDDLQELYLRGCELESLPEGFFRRQRRLVKLDLSNNRFTTVPTVLAEAVTLKYLNFGRNPVGALNDTSVFPNLIRLRELRLCRMSKLRSVSARALGGLKSLETLHLCSNPRLTDLDPEFLTWTEDEVEMWPTLRELRLNNNNLSTIHSNYLARWDRLNTLDFGNNPYICDCRSQWTIDVLIPIILKSSHNETASHMICKMPYETRGLTLVQLFETSKKLSCLENESLKASPGPDMAILLGIMIGIFVTFPIVLIVVLLWKRGFFARCRSKTIYKDDDEESYPL
ncbi:leucine-rich repeat-containing protein 15-like [Bombyx mandarina]|uniref:Leucine-rich repeat-containing protein 15-like n=1 Tax=Bombyx mandarina TaxID=7092 RepID=A0A6J2KC76_BOMMA|nr:leucine-rich repeat-containing protein 15-like [Bombyx mandarina]